MAVMAMDADAPVAMKERLEAFAGDVLSAAMNRPARERRCPTCPTSPPILPPRPRACRRSSLLGSDQHWSGLPLSGGRGGARAMMGEARSGRNAGLTGVSALVLCTIWGTIVGDGVRLIACQKNGVATCWSMNDLYAGIGGGRRAAEVVPALVELEGGGLSRLVRSRSERSGDPQDR
jgi:hypothetical protein